METIKIVIACEFVLFRKGLRILIGIDERFEIVSEASNVDELENSIVQWNPNLIVVNLVSTNHSVNTLCKSIHDKFPKIPILLFLEEGVDISIPEAIVNGVRGIIWKENSKDELIEAIETLSHGGLFFENPDNCTMNCKLSHKIQKPQPPVNISNILSHREIEVLRLISKGLSYKNIAAQLFISPRTVESHKNKIMEKLQLSSTNEIIRYAIINNI